MSVPVSEPVKRANKRCLKWWWNQVCKYKEQSKPEASLTKSPTSETAKNKAHKALNKKEKETLSEYLNRVNISVLRGEQYILF